MRQRYLTSAVLDDLSAQLTLRDRAIVQRVSELRFVSGGQLTRLYFTGSPSAAANARAARRALLRLTRLDCLARLPRTVGGVRAGSAGFIYHLGLAGQRLVAQVGQQPESLRPQPQSPGTLFLRHCLQVAELHTLLTEADRHGSLELLELRAEPACHRSYGGIGPQPARLKPDSYLRLGVGDFEDHYFVEVDLGSEGSRAIDGKLRDYLAYQASGVEQEAHGVFPKVLWLVPDSVRARVIEACIARLAAPSQELFAVARFTDALAVVNDTPT